MMPFIKKYGKASFQTVGQAMHEPGGWETHRRPARLGPVQVRSYPPEPFQ